MTQYSNVKAFIFDFGNVLINLDYQLMYGTFRSYLGKDFDSIFYGLKKDNFIEKVESGVYTAEKMTALINEYGASLSVAQLTEAWNALLLDIPSERLFLLEQLSKRYPIYLLSNTNLVHIEHIFSNLEKEYGYNPIKMSFDQLYLSYEIGFVKPQTQIYEYLLNDAHLRPSECLFFDDLQENLDGASSLGINTQLITKEYGVLDFFEEHSYLLEKELEAAE